MLVYSLTIAHNLESSVTFIWIEEGNKLSFLIDRKHKAALYFNEQAEAARSGGEQLQYSFSWKHEKRKIELALLRIAYLRTFEIRGYDFYFSHSAQVIRRQLSDPSNMKLSVFYSTHVSDMLDGVYYEKSCYHGFLVVMTLKFSECEKRYAVLLPGSGDKHMKLYRDLERQVDTNFRLIRASSI